jgi:hypothetical protein
MNFILQSTLNEAVRNLSGEELQRENREDQRPNDEITRIKYEIQTMANMQGIISNIGNSTQKVI